MTGEMLIKKKCVTIFNYVGWPETMTGNRNQIAKPDSRDILEKLDTPQVIGEDDMPFSDGHASEKIAEIIREYFAECGSIRAG